MAKKSYCLEDFDKFISIFTTVRKNNSFNSMGSTRERQENILDTYAIVKSKPVNSYFGMNPNNEYTHIFTIVYPFELLEPIGQGYIIQCDDYTYEVKEVDNIDLKNEYLVMYAAQKGILNKPQAN